MLCLRLLHLRCFGLSVFVGFRVFSDSDIVSQTLGLMVQIQMPSHSLLCYAVGKTANRRMRRHIVDAAPTDVTTDATQDAHNVKETQRQRNTSPA